MSRGCREGWEHDLGQDETAAPKFRNGGRNGYCWVWAMPGTPVDQQADVANFGLSLVNVSCDTQVPDHYVQMHVNPNKECEYL